MAGASACGFAFIPLFQDNDEIAVWMTTAGHIDAWLVLIYMAIFVGALTFNVYNYALRFIPVGRISLYYSLVAPLGVPFAAKGFSLCFRSHQMLIALLRSRHGFRTVPCDVRELLDLGK